jgi:hypothetical protein
MLSANEFLVGSISKASALTLVLPRREHEEAFLVGTSPKGTAAVFLSGTYQFRWMEATGNTHWSGLLIPNVRIEVDETTLFHTDHVHAKPGSLLRKGPQLLIHAVDSERHFGLPTPIVLEDGLLDTEEQSAGFSKWQIVIGTGYEKRILYSVHVQQNVIGS